MCAEVQAVVRAGDGRVVCERCVVADGALQRARGLLGRRSLPGGEGLLLRPCSSVHMAFMRFAIDAVFLDEREVVVRIAPGLRPWRIASRRSAHAVLELAAGQAAARGLGVGDRLALTPASPPA